MSPKACRQESHKAGAQRQEKNCAPVNPVNPPLLFSPAIILQFQLFENAF